MTGEVIDDGAIPNGEYELKYIGYWTQYAWGVPRVVVRFTVVNQGKYFEHPLDRWYRVSKLTGEAKRSGKFKVSRRSDLYREYIQLFGKGRDDRISFVGLKDKIVLGRVEAVTHNQKQKELSEELQYSTIRELVRISED